MTSFYIVLPSNTNVEGNKTNSFRVRLPQKLKFNSEWAVGLAVMVYPYSWPSLGTTSEQFFTVTWQTNESVRVNVTSSSFMNPLHLKENLNRSLNESCKELSDKMIEYKSKIKELKNQAKNEYKRLYELKANENTTKSEHAVTEHSYDDDIPLKTESEIYADLLSKTIEDSDNVVKFLLTSGSDFDSWVNAYLMPSSVCNFEFYEKKNRFSLFLDKNYIKSITLTEQLAYILGFDKHDIFETSIAKFMPDMKGGVSSFHVYAPGLIEPMIIGDVTAPVLRIVNIRGKQDEIIEEQFLLIQYHKLLIKEINEIFIEIRTSSGTLMPFQYGTCTLTLHFKKSTYF
uniref:Uncharacterized protein n=3 Tax=Meloidogyne TaxID=189290 RepID=A0A6V7X305_MELEN|nr:unnamed protein product [Meloidogyne enterolobii]CAD2199392.1 unnamed protein product [Meloidogyne enterolobii]